MTRRILVASGNPHKIEELRALSDGLPFEFVSPGHCGLELPSVVEDEPTFRGNARKKAIAGAKAWGGWALADDSGLCVEALSGKPGVLSARWAAPDGGGNASDAANRAKLLADLKGLPPSARRAYFLCALVLAAPERLLAIAEGRVDGRILDREQGEGGFGYDALFFHEAAGMTFAQMPEGEKNGLSHRAVAASELRTQLEQLAAEEEA